MPFYSIKIINSSPLQNRKRDSLFLSSRAELPLGRVFLSKDRLFWDVRPYFVGAGWRTQGTCYRQRPIGSSTWNQQVACCAEECLRQHLSDASVFGDVFFYRSFTTVLQKKGKNSLCQMTKDPTRRQPSEKGMASICDQTSSVQQH